MLKESWETNGGRGTGELKTSRRKSKVKSSMSITGCVTRPSNAGLCSIGWYFVNNLRFLVSRNVVKV